MFPFSEIKDHKKTIVYVGVSTFNPENPVKGVDYRDSYQTDGFKKNYRERLIIWMLKTPIQIGPGVQKAILMSHDVYFTLIPPIYIFGMAGYAEHPDAHTKNLILTMNTFIVKRIAISEGMILRDVKTNAECIQRFVSIDLGAVMFNALSGLLFGIHGNRMESCFITEGVWGTNREFVADVMAPR